jgi:hypothetical protein
MRRERHAVSMLREAERTHAPRSRCGFAQATIVACFAKQLKAKSSAGPGGCHGALTGRRAPSRNRSVDADELERGPGERLPWMQQVLRENLGARLLESVNRGFALSEMAIEHLEKA